MEGTYTHSAYEEGMSDYKNLPDKYENTYSHGTIAFNCYERGWVQAQKREPADIKEELYKRLGRKKLEKTMRISRTTKDLYKRRKG
ncbi:MAG: hypothetical protein ACJAQ6_000803 [Arenicella sp.]|jgi:hypothetical protein